MIAGRRRTADERDRRRVPDRSEKILAFDPEIILLGDAAYGVTPDQVAARPGWGVITAVVNDGVRPIDDVIVTRPGPRLADGIRALALAINPDLVLPSAAP
jgi:iron complex transport system substrate-binding protein